MDLSKMTNAQIDLRDNGQKKPRAEQPKEKSEHQKEFEARIERMEHEKEQVKQIDGKSDKGKDTEIKKPARPAGGLGNPPVQQAGQAGSEIGKSNPGKLDLNEKKEKIKEQIGELEHKLEELEENEITEEKEVGSKKLSSFAIATADREARRTETNGVVDGSDAPDDMIEKNDRIEDKKLRIKNEELRIKEFASKLGEEKKSEEERRSEIKKTEYKFPNGFLWGTATSAYQIEGGNMNDWSIWERSMPRLRQLMIEKKNSIDYICLRACDSYHRYEEDFDLALALNNNAIRFGLEWARIEPQKDTWDIEAINHYRNVLAAAKKRGFTTVVTLWHWTIPAWVAAEKGWENSATVDNFLKYVDLVIREFGAEIDYWLTLNEPMVPIGFGYLKGNFPPSKRYAVFKARKVLNNLATAHNKGYELIHKHFPRAKVGIACLIDYFEPLVKWEPFHKLTAFLASYFHHRHFIGKVKNHLDYIGLNYYHHNRISWLPPFRFNKNEKVNDVGWEIYPEGIYHVLKYLQKLNIPILVTENGLADANDRYRPDFIREHLYWVYKAISEGIDVRGYFHWSLLDNFEWALGWPPKFGLYAVDRNTFARSPRPSANVYAEICKKNSLKISKL